MRLRRGKLIPRDDGKRIEEFVGNATTQTRSASVARMLAPPGWAEPPQRPKFDEMVMVDVGTLTVVIDGRTERIRAGEVGLYPRGSVVTYRNDGTVACAYWSVCAPAFRPDLARMEKPSRSKRATSILLEAAHPKARAHRAFLEARARAFMATLGHEGDELSILLVGDQGIRRLNRTWRGKDRPTDVLSFPAGDRPAGTPGPRPLGDVAISLDTAARVAKEDGRSIRDELARYLAHGLLHLLGHDHEASPAAARKMAALEERLLGKGGLIAPLPSSRGRRTGRSLPP